MKIFGHPMSTCTRKVLTTLAETSTPHEFVLVDFAKGEHKQPAHLARQPFGQVPTLDDDGFALYESRAICRYIAEKASGNAKASATLIPAAPRPRALMEQWMSVETSNFTPHAMKFIYQHIFNRPQEASVLEAAGESMTKALTVLDAQLAKTPFLVGDQLTIADICFMPYFGYAMSTPAKDRFASHAHVMTWWNRVSERPSWLKATGRA